MYQKEQTLHSTDLTQPRNKLHIQSSYMKTYKQYSFGFGLVLLVMIVPGLWGKKDVNQVACDDVETLSNDTSKAQTTLIERVINGKTESINLFSSKRKNDEGRRLLWQKDYENHEYPLKVEEFASGVVLFYEYFEEIRWNEYEQEKYRFERPIPRQIEFFDKNYQLINQFNIRKNNPFLIHPIANAKVTEYFYNIAEHYSYKAETEQTGNEQISDQWIYAHVENQDNLTIIRYQTNFATSNHNIIGTKYNYIVLDTLGNEIVNFTTDYEQLTGIAFSPDAQYLMIGFTSGETVINAGIKTGSEGFEIWDTKDNLLIHRETNGDSNMWLAAPVHNKNSRSIGVSYTFPNSDSLNEHCFLLMYEKHKIFEYRTTKNWLKSQNEFFRENRRYRTWDEVLTSLHLEEKHLNYGKE